MNTTPANGGIAADLAGDLFAANQEIERLKAALSSQSQAAEGMAKALEAARKFMVVAINEAMPGMDFDPAEHLTVKQIDAALSHYRTLGEQG